VTLLSIAVEKQVRITVGLSKTLTANRDGATMQLQKTLVVLVILIRIVVAQVERGSIAGAIMIQFVMSNEGFVVMMPQPQKCVANHVAQMYSAVVKKDPMRLGTVGQTRTTSANLSRTPAVLRFPLAPATRKLQHVHVNHAAMTQIVVVKQVSGAIAWLPGTQLATQGGALLRL